MEMTTQTRQLIDAANLLGQAENVLGTVRLPETLPTYQQPRDELAQLAFELRKVFNGLVALAHAANGKAPAEREALAV